MNDDFYSIGIERDELNKQIGGGIPKNSLILIEGEDGSGKSVICQRIIFSLLSQKIKTTYISSELNTLDFLSQMNSINYDVKDFILDNSLLFITMVPFFGKVEFDEGFLQKVIDSKKIFESEIIVFDTLSFLLVKAKATTNEYLKIINFFRNLIYLNKTVIFTIDPTRLDKKLLEMLRETADIYTHIEMSEIGSDTIRVFSIKRFKRPKDLYSEKIAFRVEPKEGLLIDIGSYA